MGLVNDAFRTGSKSKFDSIMKNLSSKKAIGHVRYATSGVDDKAYAQPFEHVHGKKNRWFSISFNGNIANYPQLRLDL
ncbi:MAG: amidophosphoribosyltransferase, partial [Candidatus Diapherotrites archaeon]|nr:amidophosphoribosyltransferase [Candidatus Diapherotrites archaeon]